MLFLRIPLRIEVAGVLWSLMSAQNPELKTKLHSSAVKLYS